MIKLYTNNIYFSLHNSTHTQTPAAEYCVTFAIEVIQVCTYYADIAEFEEAVR